MPQDNLFNSWIKRARQWLNEPFNRGHPASDTVPPSNQPYPDYVTCPHCGEPEVEVWCNETTARCHNCGETFDHPLPPDCEDDSP